MHSHRTRISFPSDRGSFDMGSVIVGAVLSAALLGGLILGLSRLLPWMQDMNAKDNLAAVAAAQSAARATEGRFLNESALEEADWVDTGRDAVTEAGSGGTCYVALAHSRSKKLFFATDDTTEPQVLQDGESTGDCLDEPAQARLMTRLAAITGEEVPETPAEPESPVEPEVPELPGGGTMTFEYTCHAPTVVQVPIRDITGTTQFAWSDGVQETVRSGAFSSATGSLHSRVLPAGVTLTLDVKGTFDTVSTHWQRDAQTSITIEGIECLRAITRWDDETGIRNVQYAFASAGNLRSIPGNLPSSITDTSYMFAYSGSVGWANIDRWNTSRVTNMSHMFYYSSFNNGMSSWDTRNVRDMSYMFYGASYGGNISRWNVSSVVNHDYFRDRSAMPASNSPFG